VAVYRSYKSGKEDNYHKEITMWDYINVTILYNVGSGNYYKGCWIIYDYDGERVTSMNTGDSV